MTRAATLLDTLTSTERPDATGGEPSEAPAERLAALVERIGDDARHDPHGDLGRTVVPEGGE